MYLSRLIYYSHIVLESGNQNAFKEIKKILEDAARHNVEAGITGGLLFNQTYFAVALEGDRKAITQTFCSMVSDPRQRDIVILDAKPITERRFVSWNVGFAGKSELAAKLYVKYGASNSFNPAKMTADSLLGFIQEIVADDDVLDRLFNNKSANGNAKQTQSA